MQTANELFLHELGELLDAEQTILQMLPQQIDECSTETPVRDAFASVEKDTRHQIQNLETCFRTIGTQPTKAQSYAIRGLKQEHDAFLKERPSKEVTILFDLGEMSRNEQYAVAAYSGLVEQAKLLDQPEVGRLLQENLNQEEAIGRQIQQLSQQIRKRLVPQGARPAGTRT